jgi:hypothetical protein
MVNSPKPGKTIFFNISAPNELAPNKHTFASSIFSCPLFVIFFKNYTMNSP